MGFHLAQRLLKICGDSLPDRPHLLFGDLMMGSHLGWEDRDQGRRRAHDRREIRVFDDIGRSLPRPIFQSCWEFPGFHHATNREFRFAPSGGRFFNSHSHVLPLYSLLRLPLSYRAMTILVQILVACLFLPFPEPGRGGGCVSFWWPLSL